MKQLNIEVINNKWHITDYPDAVGLKSIDDELAKQLKAYALHEYDLRVCQESLSLMQRLSIETDQALFEALFLSALTRYCKCFGQNKSRAQIPAEKVYKDYEGALTVFQYFKDLRDKNVVHDENFLSQSFVGIIVNPIASKNKIADIISMCVNASIVDPPHFEQLLQLVEVAINWVANKREELHTMLAQKYESYSHEELMSLPDITYTAPGSEKASLTRGR
jgi:hypothetical protein